MKNGIYRLDEENWRVLATEIDWVHSEVWEKYQNFRLGIIRVSFRTTCFQNVAEKWNVAGIDFTFNCAAIGSLQEIDEGAPVAIHNKNKEFRWDLVFPEFGLGFRADNVFFELFGPEKFDSRFRIGLDGPSEECHYLAEALNTNWRQCGNCADAWEEISFRKFSRCPSCGELTELKQNE